MLQFRHCATSRGEGWLRNRFESSNGVIVLEVKPLKRRFGRFVETRKRAIIPLLQTIQEKILQTCRYSKERNRSILANR
uniref:Uncharacterized protein n=1 Tax=Nelumbo nucifera TaxID=4432 RepID=A0A822Y0Q1_NELNU|nr:TPA_asm: hypothetical protein HUJ06_026119 [Nelumbo nucifera]